MALRKRRTLEGVSGIRRGALRALVASAKFELIPLANAMERAEALPEGATVTVTASPEILERMRAGNCRRAFVVGGDTKDRGPFHDGLSLLRAIDELGRPLDEIGVPCYPEGHVDIADDVLLRVLIEKQRYASYMTTQMSFNPPAIVAWIGRMRAEGVALPVHIGTPGVAEITKLMTIATRIGIADSARYLKKNRKLVGHLLSPGKFGPDALLEGMVPALTDAAARVEALHLFTFNQVSATVEWQQRMLASLADEDAEEAEA